MGCSALENHTLDKKVLHGGPTINDTNAMTKYEDYDWEELPTEVQEAATKLGYTKKMWDEDKGELPGGRQGCAARGVGVALRDVGAPAAIPGAIKICFIFHFHG